MSFADGWPRYEKILEIMFGRCIFLFIYCDFFVAKYIFLRSSIVLVNPDLFRAHRLTYTCRSDLAIFFLNKDSQGKNIGPW